MYVKIKVKEVAMPEDLLRWEDHMQLKGKCWNSFCLDCYEAEELVPVFVEKEGMEEITFLTTLCKDCISSNSDNGILVKENHLMVV